VPVGPRWSVPPRVRSPSLDHVPNRAPSGPSPIAWPVGLVAVTVAPERIRTSSLASGLHDGTVPAPMPGPLLVPEAVTTAFAMVMPSAGAVAPQNPTPMPGAP